MDAGWRKAGRNGRREAEGSRGSELVVQLLLMELAIVERQLLRQGRRLAFLLAPGG